MLKIAMGMQREYSLFYVFSFMSSLCFLSKSYRGFLFLYNPQNEMLPFHKTKCSETQNEASSL